FSKEKSNRFFNLTFSKNHVYYLIQTKWSVISVGFSTNILRGIIMDEIKTKDKILRTSFDLFLKEGFTDVSINDIIKKGGFSKGGFFHYFKSKDHLFKEIIQSFIIPYIEITARNISGKNKATYDKLKAFFGLISNYDELIRSITNDEAIDGRSLYLLMMEALKKFSYFREQYSEIFLTIYDLIREQLAEGKKKGEIRKDLDLEAVSYEILISYEGALHLWIVEPDMDLDKLNKKLFNSIWNSIKAYE
ncbi:MAG: TetR/AcrR family transcriptional regulator, partial [candidate division WOR-3 bacterium]